MSSSAKLWETDTSHTLIGVQDGTSPTKKGVGKSGQTTYVFTPGPSHPTQESMRNNQTHSHEVIHCWGALLKIAHDSQHTHNKIN